MNATEYPYDDDYPTCARTWATLRLYPGEIDPNTITQELGIQPSSTNRKGEHRNPHARNPIRIHGWFLSSREAVPSRDATRHVDWLIDQLEPARESLRQLQTTGCRMDISCFWESAGCAGGGPLLYPRQMQRLAELGLEIWFDFYPAPHDDEGEHRWASEPG